MTETTLIHQPATGGYEMTRFNALTSRRAVRLDRPPLGGRRRVPRAS